MPLQTKPNRRSAGVLVWPLVWVMCLSLAHAQTTPKIEFLFPAGAQRGTAVNVQFGGEYMPEGCRLFTVGAGLAVQSVDGSSAYRFTVASDAAAGPREIRLSATQGASAPFPFLIGELPEIVHPDTSEPLPLTLPVTANGRLTVAGDIDEYSLKLAAGTQVVCAVSTRAIRSPVDPMLRMLDPDGKPVATSNSHRSADALLVFRALKPGTYRLQVFDFQMAGGAENVYRLTVTDGPWLDYVFPAGLSRDVETPVTVFGWNLPSGQASTPSGAFELRVPAQSVGRFELTLPGSVNRLSVPVGDHSEVLEAEPNDAAEQAGAISVPVTVNGRLHRRGDVDVFAFNAKKAERLAIEVDSADLQFPTDLVLTMSNDAGKALSEVDDVKTSRDPRLNFTAPAEGRYFVSIRDRSRGGGADCVYRLHLSTTLRPDATARVNASSLVLHSGQTVNLPVLVERIDGLTSELEVIVLGLPAGIDVKPQPVPTKTPATISLPFVVADTTAPISGLVQIVLRDPKAGAATDRIALIAESAAATSGSHDLALAVSPEVPFTLSITGPILDAPRMAGFPFPVGVTRKAGFTAPIRLVGVEADRRGTLIPLAGLIAAESDRGTIPLVLQHNVTEGSTHRSRVMGVAEVPGIDGKNYTVFHVATGAMSVGCQPSWLTMTVEPGLLIRRQGEEQSIEVRLMRRVTMAPVKLRLVSPSGVVGIECDPVEVGIDQDRATLLLRVAANAQQPPRVLIEIHAESSRDGLPIYGKTSFRLESR